MMYHIPGVLSAQDVAWFREQPNIINRADGRVITGTQEAQVKNNQQANTQSKRYDVLQQVVQTAIDNGALFFAAVLPKTLSVPLFNRYQDNEIYGFHVDDAVCSHPQDDWMRTNLSATLFLSNPNGYKGGKLLANDTYGRHTVKLPTGDLVLYPSSSLHYVTPIIHGVCVTSFIWIQLMVRDNKNRAMLSELDKNIQSLRAHHGESSEILSLPNLYYNLLREWSEI